jgi:MFS family permease
MTALNGLGLALVIPAATSLIADLYDPHQRGRAFGVIMTVSAAGAAVLRPVGP